MTLLPDNELRAVEEWFAELQAALGCKPTADRGRVLAAVRKLKEEAATYAEEKRVVAKATGHQRWGDFYNECASKLGKTPEVELPDVFSNPPVGWLVGTGKSWDKAVKRLTKTQSLLKKTWAAIEQNAKEENWEPGEEEESKQELVEAFTKSVSPDSLEETCYKYITGYEEEEEEDPATTWVEVASLASSYLETESDLPLTAVGELLTYASEAQVELTKLRVAWFTDSDYSVSKWFYYLLTTYLLDASRATEEEVMQTTELALKAVELWGCTTKEPGNNPLRASIKRTVWDPNVNVKQLKAAYNAVVELKEQGKSLSTQEWQEQVKQAVKQTEEDTATTAA